MTRQTEARGFRLDWPAVLAGFAIAVGLSLPVGQLLGAAGGFGGFVGLTLAIFAVAGFVTTKLARRPGPGQAVAVAVIYIVVAAVLQDIADFRAAGDTKPADILRLDTLGIMFEDLLRLAGALAGGLLASRT